MAKKIFGQVGRLKLDKIDEYVSLHAAVWPGVLKTITACNMSNYAIFLKNDLVFGYFEYNGTDYQGDMEKMAADPVTQEWWSKTKPCFTNYNELSLEAFYEDMEQIFCY